MVTGEPSVTTTLVGALRTQLWCASSWAFLQQVMNGHLTLTNYFIPLCPSEFKGLMCLYSMQVFAVGILDSSYVNGFQGCQNDLNCHHSQLICIIACVDGSNMRYEISAEGRNMHM